MVGASEFSPPQPLCWVGAEFLPNEGAFRGDRLSAGVRWRVSVGISEHPSVRAQERGRCRQRDCVCVRYLCAYAW